MTRTRPPSKNPCRAMHLLLLVAVATLVLGFLAPIFAQELSEGDLIPRKNATEAASPAAPSSTGESRTSSPPVADDPVPSTVTPNQATNPPAAASNDPSPASMGFIILAMLITGMLLLFVEVALIPGFGVTGVSGILVILGGLGLAFWKLDPQVAALYTIGSIGALIALVFWAIYVFPHTSMGKRFVLNTRITIEDGFTAVQDLSRFVGLEGVATSDLRPSGIANLGGERVDVMSEGDFIPRGTKIRALKQKQTNLIVVPIEPPKA